MAQFVGRRSGRNVITAIMCGDFAAGVFEGIARARRPRYYGKNAAGIAPGRVRY